MASLMPLQKSITPWKVRVPVAIWGKSGREEVIERVGGARALGIRHRTEKWGHA